MTKWNAVRIALGVVVLGLVAATSGHSLSVGHENHLTFSRPVALPGVVLPAGAYSFDLMDSNSSLNIVVVRNREHSKVFYLGFTALVERPKGMSPNNPITFAEAPANQPRPIATWYEVGDSIGHQFLYR